MFVCTTKFPFLITKSIPFLTSSSTIFLNVIVCVKADKVVWYGINNNLSFAYNHFTPNSNAFLLNIIQVTGFISNPLSASMLAFAKLPNNLLLSKNSKFDIFLPLIKIFIH